MNSEGINPFLEFSLLLLLLPLTANLLLQQDLMDFIFADDQALFLGFDFFFVGYLQADLLVCFSLDSSGLVPVSTLLNFYGPCPAFCGLFDSCLILVWFMHVGKSCLVFLLFIILKKLWVFGVQWTFSSRHLTGFARWFLLFIFVYLCLAIPNVFLIYFSSLFYRILVLMLTVFIQGPLFPPWIIVYTRATLSKFTCDLMVTKLVLLLKPKLPEYIQAGYILCYFDNIWLCFLVEEITTYRGYFILQMCFF